MTTQNQNQNQSNTLIYRTSKTVGRETIYVKISLDDDCKNGHQDFSITGDIYEANKPKIDKHHISGGCIHDDILKHFPQFKQFIDLHLCDYDGVPMHPTANMFYHLETGFTKEKKGTPEFKKAFCDYYRLTPLQFDTLEQSKSKTHLAILLNELGILKQWKKEAKKAIKELEKLTGLKFLNDSRRSMYIAPTKEELKEHKKRMLEGYYTPEKERERIEAAKGALFAEWDKELNAKTALAKLEVDIKKQLYCLGGKRFVDNAIFYTHSKQIGLNWRTYGNELDESEINTIKQCLIVPEGVTYK